MHEAVSDIIARRRADPDGLGRLMSQSVAIHVLAVVLLFVVPRDWISREKEKPLLMTISLGGSLGEKSGGMLSASARAVEEVVPPPKRPEPIRPATKPEPDALVVPTKPPVKTPPKPASEPAKATTAPLTRPATGAQVQKGTAAAETGSRSQETGLTFGGGAGGTSVTLDNDFCCKEYIEEMIRRINSNWDKAQPDSGTITLMFEVSRDGTFTKPVIEMDKSTGSTPLRLASLAPFAKLKLDPLPKEYPSDKLKIHLTFPYVR